MDIKADKRAVQVACGLYHTAVLFEDGTVSLFGCNADGQCTHDTKYNTNTRPHTNAGDSLGIKCRKVSMVACGDNHTAVAYIGGGVHVFGDNK